jgi:hypothetical protein
MRDEADDGCRDVRQAQPKRCGWYPTGLLLFGSSKTGLLALCMIDMTVGNGGADVQGLSRHI